MRPGGCGASSADSPLGCRAALSAHETASIGYEPRTRASRVRFRAGRTHARPHSPALRAGMRDPRRDGANWWGPRFPLITRLGKSPPTLQPPSRILCSRRVLAGRGRRPSPATHRSGARGRGAIGVRARGSRPWPAHRGVPPGPGRPATGRAASRPRLAAWAVPDSRTAADAARSASNQATACSRQRARERASGGPSSRPLPAPANAAARAAWKRFPDGRVGRQRRRGGERVGPQAGRRRVEVPGEGEPGEFRARFRVGGAVASLHDGGQPRLQRDQVLRSRRQGRRAEFRVRGRGAGVDVRQRLQGRPVVARLDQGPAQVEVGRREAGFETDGLAEFGDGVVECARRPRGRGRAPCARPPGRGTDGPIPSAPRPRRPNRPGRRARGRSGRGPPSRPASIVGPRRTRRPPRAARRASGGPTRARRGRGRRRAGAGSPPGGCRRPPTAGRSGGGPSPGP